MRSRKSRHIRPSGAFWPEVTKSCDRKRNCPEVALTGSRFCACPAFPRVFFLLVVTWLPKVTWPLPEFPWVCATGNYATPVVTEGHVIPWKLALTESMFCACPAFPPCFFLSSSNMATEGHLTPSGFPWVCACPTRAHAQNILPDSALDWCHFRSRSYSRPGRVKPNTIQLVFVASLLSTQH